MKTQQPMQSTELKAKPKKPQNPNKTAEPT